MDIISTTSKSRFRVGNVSSTMMEELRKIYGNNIKDIVTVDEEELKVLNEKGQHSRAAVQAIFRVGGRIAPVSYLGFLRDEVMSDPYLRTNYYFGNGKLWRIILNSNTIQPVFRAADSLDPNDLMDTMHRIAEADRRRPFDLRKGKLLRIYIFRISNEEYMFLLSWPLLIDKHWTPHNLFHHPMIIYSRMEEFSVAETVTMEANELEYNVGLLSETPLLLSLNKTQIRSLLDSCWVTSYQKDDVILNENVNQTAMLVLLTGRVARFSKGDDEWMKPLDEVEEGQLLNPQVVLGVPSSFLLEAVEECQILHIPRMQFKHLLQNHNDVGWQAFKAITRELDHYQKCWTKAQESVKTKNNVPEGQEDQVEKEDSVV